MSLQLASDEHIIRFGNLIMPAGWYVVQLDSGHYMTTNEDQSVQSCITVNRYHARRWACQLAQAARKDVQINTQGVL